MEEEGVPPDSAALEAELSNLSYDALVARAREAGVDEARVELWSLEINAPAEDKSEIVAELVRLATQVHERSTDGYPPDPQPEPEQEQELRSELQLLEDQPIDVAGTATVILISKRGHPRCGSVVESLAAFLDLARLGEYLNILQANGVDDVEDVLRMKDEDLQSCGMSKPYHRTKFIRCAKLCSMTVGGRPVPIEDSPRSTAQRTHQKHVEQQFTAITNAGKKQAQQFLVSQDYDVQQAVVDYQDARTSQLQYLQNLGFTEEQGQQMQDLAKGDLERVDMIVSVVQATGLSAIVAERYLAEHKWDVEGATSAALDHIERVQEAFVRCSPEDATALLDRNGGDVAAAQTDKLQLAPRLVECVRLHLAQVESTIHLRTCLDRQWVQREISLAQRFGKQIIVVYEGDTEKSAFFDLNRAYAKYQDGGQFTDIFQVDMIQYRRQRHEVEAMLDRIEARMGQDSPTVAAAETPINSPGRWDFFLSYHREVAADQTNTLNLLLKRRNYSVWHDQQMDDAGHGAPLEEGVKHSTNFLLFLSGDPDEALDRRRIALAQGLSATTSLGVQHAATYPGTGQQEQALPSQGVSSELSAMTSLGVQRAATYPGTVQQMQALPSQGVSSELSATTSPGVQRAATYPGTVQQMQALPSQGVSSELSATTSPGVQRAATYPGTVQQMRELPQRDKNEQQWVSSPVDHGTGSLVTNFITSITQAPEPDVESDPAPEYRGKMTKYGLPDRRTREWRQFCEEHSEQTEQDLIQRFRAVNPPGHWDIMLSYTQANPIAQKWAQILHTEICTRRRTVWLDVKMQQLNEAAMKEAAQKSKCIVAIITGPALNPSKPGDDQRKNAYYARRYTLNELRWARDSGVPIQPVVVREDKPKIGDFIAQLPKDLKDLQDVDFKTLDDTTPAFLETSVNEVLAGVQHLVADEGSELERHASPMSTASHPHIVHIRKDPKPELIEWLAEIDLDEYADAMADLGYRSLRRLENASEEHIHALMSELRMQYPEQVELKAAWEDLRKSCTHLRPTPNESLSSILQQISATCLIDGGNEKIDSEIGSAKATGSKTGGKAEAFSNMVEQQGQPADELSWQQALESLTSLLRTLQPQPEPEPELELELEPEPEPEPTM